MGQIALVQVEIWRAKLLGNIQSNQLQIGGTRAHFQCYNTNYIVRFILGILGVRRHLVGNLPINYYDHSFLKFYIKYFTV